jgi:hypothetical protein
MLVVHGQKASIAWLPTLGW